MSTQQTQSTQTNDARAMREWVDETKLMISHMSRNPKAINYLEANQDKIDWRALSKNPNAIQLLEANQDKIDWWQLSGNPAAIHLLEENPDEIDWEWLSGNPAAIHLLEANQDKIDWDEFSHNPAIFIYDYQKLRTNKLTINREVVEYVYHPDRVERLLE